MLTLDVVGLEGQSSRWSIQHLHKNCIEVLVYIVGRVGDGSEEGPDLSWPKCQKEGFGIVLTGK